MCYLLEVWVSFIQTAQDLGMFQMSECFGWWDLCVDFTQVSIPNLKIKLERRFMSKSFNGVIQSLKMF